MIERTGDMFTSDATALGHGVNCAGVMGAGVAKTFRGKFPHNYENYRAACLAGMLKPGQIAVNREDEKYIVNMATQNKPGADASYPWLFEAAYTAAEQAVANGIPVIAIPEIGSGIGGLDAWKVKMLLKDIEHMVNEGVTAGRGRKFEWELWHYGI